MARQFNGTTQALKSASTIDLSAAGTGSITLAFWLWWDAFANDDDLAFESSANFNSNAGSFIVDPNDSGTGAIQFGHSAGGGGNFRLVSIVRPTAATWHHYTLVMDTASTSNFVAYVDGTSVTVTSRTNNAGAAWGNYTLNVMSRNAASLFGAGRIAGIGLWTSALTAGNAATLAAGAAPSTVGSPVAAWNICGTTSPEPAAVGASALNLTASPLQVADPSAFASVCSGTAFPFVMQLSAQRI